MEHLRQITTEFVIIMSRTINELTLTRLRMLIHDWEMQLRQKVKYGETSDTTWEEVREMYYEIRNDYAQLDLLDYEEDAVESNRAYIQKQLIPTSVFEVLQAAGMGEPVKRNDFIDAFQELKAWRDSP